MKRLLLITFAIIAMSLTSCNYVNRSSKDDGDVQEKTIIDYPPELIEMANQYHLNIDTIKTYDLDIKVYQTLSGNECLAHECSNTRYGWYSGQSIYYMTSSMLYDDEVIKEKAYLLGTYRYKTVDTIRQYKVVPFYCETNQYNSLKEDGFFDLILELQDY